MGSFQHSLSRLCEAARKIITRAQASLGSRAKAIAYTLVVVAGAVLLFSLIRNWKNLDWHAYRLDPGYLLLSLIPHAFAFSLGGLGWAFVVKRIDASQSISDSFRIYFLSSVGRNLPGGFWHIVGRLHLHRRAGGSGTATLVATGIELILAVLAGTAIYAVGVLSTSVDSIIPHGWLVALLLLEGIVLMPPIFNMVVNWSIHISTDQDVAPISVGLSTILQWVGLYLVILFMGGVVLCVVGNAVYPLEWQRLPSLAGAWGISMAVSGLTFWIPVRLGIRDGILVMALSEQIPFSAALVIAALWRVWISVMEILWAVLAGLVTWLRSR